MNKQQLRKQYIEIRKSIFDKELKSKEITNKVISFESYNLAKVIAIYNSFEDEVDTQDLIKYSIEQNKIVVLPKVINKSQMKFYKISSLDRLEIGVWGIKEPIEDENNLVQANEIDLMIVPGVCFDRNKNRIGFGGGYYDRYLSSKNNILKIGVCFDEQLLNEDFIDSDINDVKMDTVITDRKIIN